jgi:hypothetical protein
VFTATIANFFMVEQGESEIAEMRDQLRRIEHKLDRVIEEQREDHQARQRARRSLRAALQVLELICLVRRNQQA